MFNKKIFMSVLIIGIICALAGSATWAYFQDTEYSNDNTLTAGTIDLTLTNAPFVVGTTLHPFPDGVAPGDFGTENQTIRNIGSLEGELDITFSAITNTNGIGGTEYEESGSGELGGEAEMLVFIDVDGGGTFTQNDMILKSDGTVISAPESPSAETYYATINSYDGDDFDKALILMDSGARYDVYFKWRVPGDTGNSIQGDTVSFDVTYTLEQEELD